jgi:hypothetical protein
VATGSFGTTKKRGTAMSNGQEKAEIFVDEKQRSSTKPGGKVLLSTPFLYLERRNTFANQGNRPPRR